MKKRFSVKNFVIGIALVVIFLSIYELFRRNVGAFAGTYPFAEKWLIKRSIEDVGESLILFHKVSPTSFNDTSNLDLRSDPNGLWKEVYFSYPERSEVVQVLFATSNDCKRCTVVSLVSFIDMNDGTVRLMNKDFNYFANRREKRIFEHRILKYIDEEYSSEL